MKEEQDTSDGLRQRITSLEAKIDDVYNLYHVENMECMRLKELQLKEEDMKNEQGEMNNELQEMHKRLDTLSKENQSLRNDLEVRSNLY